MLETSEAVERKLFRGRKSWVYFAHLNGQGRNAYVVALWKLLNTVMNAKQPTVANISNSLRL